MLIECFYGRPNLLTQQSDLSNMVLTSSYTSSLNLHVFLCDVLKTLILLLSFHEFSFRNILYVFFLLTFTMWISPNIFLLFNPLFWLITLFNFYQMSFCKNLRAYIFYLILAMFSVFFYYSMICVQHFIWLVVCYFYLFILFYILFNYLFIFFFAQLSKFCSYHTITLQYVTSLLRLYLFYNLWQSIYFNLKHKYQE